MGSEMGPLSSPGVTSYRLPIVTIGLSLTVFAVLRMFQTDGQSERQTDGRNSWARTRGAQLSAWYTVKTYNKLPL